MEFSSIRLARTPATTSTPEWIRTASCTVAHVANACATTAVRTEKTSLTISMMSRWLIRSTDTTAITSRQRGDKEATSLLFHISKMRYDAKSDSNQDAGTNTSHARRWAYACLHDARAFGYATGWYGYARNFCVCC